MKFSSFPSFPPPRALLGHPPIRAFYHLCPFHQNMSLPDIIRFPALVYNGTVEKQMSLAAVLALVIGGAGASIPKVVMLKRIFKMPIMAGFLASVFGMAVPSASTCTHYGSRQVRIQGDAIGHRTIHERSHQAIRTSGFPTNTAISSQSDCRCRVFPTEIETKHWEGRWF